MWASGFSLTMVNPSLSKINQGHAEMRCSTSLIRLTYSVCVISKKIFYTLFDCEIKNTSFSQDHLQLELTIYTNTFFPNWTSTVNLPSICVQIHSPSSESVSHSSLGLFNNLDWFIFELKAHHIMKAISRVFCCCSKHRSSAFEFNEPRLVQLGESLLEFNNGFHSVSLCRKKNLWTSVVIVLGSIWEYYGKAHSGRFIRKCPPRLRYNIHNNGITWWSR